MRINLLNTEGKLAIQHQVEQNSKRPHINLKTINFICIDLWRHIILSSKDGAIYVILSLRKNEIRQLVGLNKKYITGL